MIWFSCTRLGLISSLLLLMGGTCSHGQLVRDTRVSYVMEPFESIHEEWFQSDADILNLTHTLNKEHALFGNHSLRVEYATDSEFGWILPTRPHNCHGADSFSIWFKNINLEGTTSRAATLRVSLLEDRACMVLNHIPIVPSYLTCVDPDSLEAYTILEHAIVQAAGENDWQELTVETTEFTKLDLTRLRGWKIEVISGGGGGAFLLDQLSCNGGGSMLGSAFFTRTDLQDAIQDGTWMESYYQSQTAKNYTQSMLTETGALSVDYMIEQVESWGGFIDYAHVAPGAAYYNLSEGNTLVLDYDVSQPASIPGRAIFRLVLQDNSHCDQDCDTDYHGHERWYSFHSILDKAGPGSLMIPMQGSIEPTTPFWLTGWSGITGNAKLDTTQLKGFTLELVLDSVLEQGTSVTGAVSFHNMAAAETIQAADAEMSYVMEPFEIVDQEWGRYDGDDPSTMLNLSLSETALFGDYALRVEYNNAAQDNNVYFHWVQRLRPHNCHAAEHITLWYKSLKPGAHIRFILFDDTSCILSEKNCSDGGNLDPYVLLDQELEEDDDWQELRVGDFGDLDLRRIRGWMIELVGESGSFLLDQLSCVGGGSMLGSAFYAATSFADAISEVSWMESYYQSKISRNSSDAALENGRLSIDYAVEQVEDWGGFLDIAHLAPGAAYYNLSLATALLLSYNVKEEASIPGRAIFRLVLQENSDCEADCDTDYHSHERYYSFNSILDDAGPGQLIIPLEGSAEPTSPFWLTGWSGITGNAQLDLGNLKGFTLEFVLDSSLSLGSLVSGSVELFDLAAVVSLIEEQDEFLGECVVEADLHFLQHGPHFTRLEFLGAQCCETCAENPDCLYALSTGRDCYVASYIDPNYVTLLNNEIEQNVLKSFWMDDVSKRGAFCEKCDCREEDRTIDCKGSDLLIMPKTFEQRWTPSVLDLRENPKLVLLGSNSLSAIEQTLEEILLPISMKHIAPQSLKDLPKLKSIQFEGDQYVNHYLINTITTPNEFFADICCGIGSQIDLALPDVLAFCNMQISLPGVDAAYEPFINYVDTDADTFQVLTPSSAFMAEAAESVEKCAEYCTINDACRFFSYDARLPNAEHACHLLAHVRSHPETVCCDRDHYADEEGTVPGWISGRPPQTRHDVDDARVLLDYHNLVVSTGNGFRVEYQVSLGSTPIRGAVWVKPTLVSVSSGLDVSFSPSRLVLYDSAQTVTVAVSVNGVTQDSPPATLVVRNVITSCDAAFAVPGGSEDNTVYVVVEVPEEEEDLNLGLAIGLPIAFALVIGLAVFLFYEHKRKENESVWKVKKEELQFSDPPKIIGRGTFGLVLMAEYRGTQVAVKHVIPPRGKQESDPMASGTNKSVSKTSNTNNGGRNLSLSGSYNVGMTSGSSGVGKISGSNKSDTANWRKLRHEFIEEMRHLSKLRHPCVTTVMGAVIGNKVEPMLVMEYMDHGSLYDLLHNETMVIEGELLLPILRDVSQGVRFLHSATPQVLHGDLKAQNILVDSKFRAKVADFGLSQKKNVGGTGTPFWMAPELLRGESTNTAASDVYSFGVILYEVYSRKDPYEGEDPREVLRLVADQSVSKRPPIPQDCPSQVQSLMTDCLNDDPNKRPTFEELDTRLKRADAATVHPGQISTKKISFSLFDIFPKHIAEALQAGRTVEPEHRDVVTIFFSDIVGFTNISSKLPPRKVAEMLDRLYTKFDALSRKHDVFKVETIGDSYMAVTNLVKDQPLDHVKRMTEFAIDTVKAANDTYIDPDDQGKGFVNVRIGFHCGSVVADVVGTMNPRYCLFGDSVNTASRMESSSEVNRIHCSSAAAEILMGQQPSLPLKSRGLIHIKGKGDMHTYWVNEHEDGATNETDEISFTENTILDWAKGKPPSQGLKMEPVKEEAHPDAQSDEFQVEETEAHQDAHSDDFQEEETNESLHDDLEAQESSH